MRVDKNVSTFKRDNYAEISVNIKGEYFETYLNVNDVIISKICE